MARAVARWNPRVRAGPECRQRRERSIVLWPRESRELSPRARQRIPEPDRAQVQGAPRHRWHSWHPGQCGFCKVQILRSLAGFKPHPPTKPSASTQAANSAVSRPPHVLFRAHIRPRLGSSESATAGRSFAVRRVATMRGAYRSAANAPLPRPSSERRRDRRVPPQACRRAYLNASSRPS